MTTRGKVLSTAAHVAALSLVLLPAACGKKAKPPAPLPAPVVEKKPAPPPPPPPVCIPPSEPAMVTMANGDAAAVQFCVGDGADQKSCFGVDLDDKKYEALDASPIPQEATLTDGAAFSSTATEVKVCPPGEGAACVTLKAKAPKGQDTAIVGATNAAGTLAVLMFGNAEAGKGYAEVWDVAKNKKTATIKYAKGDNKCGVGQVLGDAVYINASVCAGPAAKGALYSAKGKKLADVGGKGFGTYGAAAVQVDATRWAFLEEGAGAVALQDVKTGKLDKTLDLLPLWGGGAGGAERAGGNPGESALVRGGEGKLIVITGSPVAGNVGVIDVASGEIQVITALQCAGADAPATDAGAAPAEDAEGGAAEE
jgi:hypothetical protein